MEIEQLGKLLLEYAARYQGFPVAVVNNGGTISFGVVGLVLDRDDWFLVPGQLDTLLEPSESIGHGDQNKKPQASAVGDGDPERT